MNAGQILAFILVALIAGTAAAALLERRKSKRKQSPLRNTIIGGAGALIGQILFDVIDIDLPDILSGSITLADVLIAIVGAALVLLVVNYLGK